MSRAFVPRALALLLSAGALVLLPFSASAQEFVPSAPDEIISDASKTRRTFVVTDMIRVGLAKTVEQGPRGILRVGVGDNFHSLPSREHYFRKLISAYYEWDAEDGPLVVEFWEQGSKIGEYASGDFAMEPGYTPPVAAAPTPAAGVTAAAVPGEESQAPAEQVPSKHAGWHFTLGLGGGGARLSCDGCDFARETAPSGYLSLGAAISPKFLVGIEGTGWTQGGDAQVYSVMAQVTGYFNETSGMFVTSGFGLVGRQEDSRVGSLSANGFGFSSRVGYELEIGGSVLLIPYLAYLTTLGGAKFQFNDQDVGEYDISNVQFGVALGIN
jgi:hypothetical protein